MSEGKKYSVLINTALRTVENDYMYMFSTQDLADHLGISKHHLIREFNKHLSITPNKYLTKYKLEKSKALLTSGLSIDTVAIASGFSCGNYYSKLFKKEFSITPSEYVNNNGFDPYIQSSIYL